MKQKSDLSCPACAGFNLRRMMPQTLSVSGGDLLRTYIYECSICSHRFMHTTSEQQRAIEHNYDEVYTGFRHDQIFARKISEEITCNIMTRKPPPARILDVGCGSGVFMQAALEHGYQLQGVDSSAAAVKFCKQRGLPARAGDFISMHFEEDFDLITMWDVVEHLRQPDLFFKRARGLLKPDGYLIYKIPGFGQLSFPPIAVLNRLSKIILGAPEHVQYFTPKSLNALLSRCGFSEIERFESRDLRSNPRTKSFKRKVGRAGAYMVKMVAGNKNLYGAAR